MFRVKVVWIIGAASFLLSVVVGALGDVTPGTMMTRALSLSVGFVVFARLVQVFWDRFLVVPTDQDGVESDDESGPTGDRVDLMVDDPLDDPGIAGEPAESTDAGDWDGASDTEMELDPLPGDSSENGSFLKGGDGSEGFKPIELDGVDSARIEDTTEELFGESRNSLEIAEAVRTILQTDQEG